MLDVMDEDAVWLQWKGDDAEVAGGFVGCEFPLIWPPRCHCDECEAAR